MSPSTRRPGADPRDPHEPDGHPAGSLPGDTIETADTIRMPGPLHRVYRFFISKRTGIGLIMAMAFLTLMGTLLVQSTEAVRSDPQAYAQWLDDIRPKYRGWTPVLDAVGLFDVFGSIWFKAVNVLLCISILCCVLHRLPLLWKRATRPQLHVTEGFFGHAGMHHEMLVPGEPAAVMDRARTALRGARYRVLDDPKGPGLNVYADRFRWMPFGTIAAHIAFVVILLGVLITANTGFSEDNFPVAIGDTVEVGHGTGLAVRADSFTDSYYPDGRPKDYVSHLVLLKDGRQVAEQDVRVNQPLRADGVKVFQASFGFAARVKVTDAKGTVVYHGGVPLQYTTEDGKNAFGKISLPGGRGVDAYAITAASGQLDERIRPGELAVKVQTAGTDETVGQEVVAQGASATVGDLTYTFEREQQYTGLMVSDDPGAVWVWIGSTMILVGMTLTMFCRHRRVWVRVHPAPDGVRLRLASAERNDTAYASWLERFCAGLAADLGGELTDDVPHERRRAGRAAHGVGAPVATPVGAPADTTDLISDRPTVGA